MMVMSEIIDDIQGVLFDEGVYRADADVLSLWNDAVKLLAALTLFDERMVSIDIDGTRNYVALPKDGSDECLVPLYIADANTGARINPAKLDQFEFYQSQWEGVVGTGASKYYYVSNPSSYAYASIVFCPISYVGKAQYKILGAFVPADYLTTSTVDLTDEQVSCAVRYVLFMCYVAEPGRADDALIQYMEFLRMLNEIVGSQKARFPSGRDYEPIPVEIKQLANKTYQEKKSAKEAEE